MEPRVSLTPEGVEHIIQTHLESRQAELLPSGEQAKDGRKFRWCGDVLEYLAEGLSERLASLGITLSNSFPGPLRLMDEEQHQDGRHVRRFWTVAFERGCPVARLCTYFYHRHDQVMLPQWPKVVAYPPDHEDGEAP